VTPGPLVARGRVVMVFLGLTAVVDLARLAFVVSETAYLRAVLNGETISLSAARASDDRITAATGFALLLLIATGTAWCIWQHRGHRNLRDLGRAHLKFTPAWAVGWWFIPIANLFKPFQSVRELWQASEPIGDGAHWSMSSTWPVIGGWWVCWIAPNVLAWGARGMRSSEDLHTIVSGDYLWMASDALLIVAAILAIAIVRSVLERQAALMMLGPAPTAVPLMPLAIPPPPPPMPPMP